MQLSSRSLNGYDASLIGIHGVGDITKYGFGLGAATCYQYYADGTCVSSTSDGGATTTPCSDADGNPLNTPGCADMNTLTPASTGTNTTPVSSSLLSSLTSTPAILAIGGIVFFMILVGGSGRRY